MTNIKYKTAKFISKGVKYLAVQQEKTGNFISLSSPDQENFTQALQFHSTFSTSLILSTLNTVEETLQVKKIKQKAAAFLLTQRTNHWSYNYWLRNSSEANSMPYPDDLDDTFCALAALHQYNPKIINGEAMAKIVQLLTHNEMTEGGPYITWLVTKKADKKWKDIDIAVNSNIAYFLDINEVHLPRLTAFIEKKVEDEELTSTYYPSIYPIIYF